MKINLVLGLTFFCISSLFSQTKDVGVPVGWNKKLNPNNIPLEIMKGNLDIGITGRDLIFEKVLGWQKKYLMLKT